MKYECKICEFATKFKSHYDEHMKTKKHSKKEAESKKEVDESLKSEKSLELQSKDNKDSLILYVETSPDNGYKCPDCGFSTKYNSNYTRHKQTCVLKDKKDNVIPKLNDSLECPICKLKCTLKRTYLRHIRVCIEKHKTNADKDVQIMKLSYEKKLVEKELETTTKMNEMLMQQNKSTHQLAAASTCNVSGLIQTNMRAMTFLRKHMDDTPALTKFVDEYEDSYYFFIDYDGHRESKIKDTLQMNSKKNILYYDEDKMTKDEFIIDHILFLQKSNKTATFIAERLIFFYKKVGDSVKQSIWNIDMYRYNFAICLKSGDKVIWHSDKQGKLTNDILITPLLEFICGILEKNLGSMQKKVEEYALEKKTNEMINTVKDMGLLTDFITSVRNNELQQEIIKKISPAFTLDVPKQIESVLKIKE